MKLRLLKEEYFNEDILSEMATLKRDRTGLPVHIWIDEFGSQRSSKHNLPRVKIQCDKGNDLKNLISVSIEDYPQILNGEKNLKLQKSELNQIFDFISNNKTELLELWNGEIDFDELIQILIDKGSYKRKNS